MRRPRRSRRSASACFSIGLRKNFANWRWLPSRPGSTASNCAHSSPRWFSSGVPVIAMRWRADSSRTTRAAWLRAFLIACASSSTSTE